MRPWVAAPYAHLAEDASDNAATDEILAAAERVR
jgi:hypothetical protein